MVKKLFKHEYLAWMRVLPLIYGITLVIATMLRVIMIFENNSVYYNIVLFSAVFMFIVALIATVAAPIIFGIRRFYTNLFTGEGYLTHTLPVTPANHLWVKAVTASSFSLLSVIVCLLAGMIAASGEVLSEIWKAAAYLLKQIPEAFLGHAALWAAEYAVLMLIAVFASHFLYYLCICVGQLFRKNRVLAAVGVYFGLYMITQIVSTVLMVSFVIMGEAGIWENVLNWIGKNPKETIHIFLCGMVVLYALLTMAYYWICHHILRKKLNLE